MEISEWGHKSYNGISSRENWIQIHHNDQSLITLRVSIVNPGDPPPDDPYYGDGPPIGDACVGKLGITIKIY